MVWISSTNWNAFSPISLNESPKIWETHQKPQLQIISHLMQIRCRFQRTDESLFKDIRLSPSANRIFVKFLLFIQQIFTEHLVKSKYSTFATSFLIIAAVTKNYNPTIL